MGTVLSFLEGTWLSSKTPVGAMPERPQDREVEKAACEYTHLLNTPKF